MRKLSKPFLATTLLIVLLIIGIVVGGCQPGATPSQETPKDKPETSEQPESKEPYKIGFLTTLSGPLGFYGTDVRDAAQLEVDRINAAGGINGHPIELVIEDNGNDPSKAVSAMTKLIRQDNVLAVTGTFVGTIDAAVRVVAEREHVPFVVCSPNTPEQRAREDKYVFNMGVNEMVNAQVWIDIIKALGYTSGVGISANDSVCLTMITEFKNQVPAQGISFELLPDYINLEQIDVTPQVAKLKELADKNNAQVLITTNWTNNMPAMLKTMQQMGLNIPVIGFDPHADMSILEMGGDELNGLMATGSRLLAGELLPDSDPQKNIVIDFKKRYEEETGRLAGTFCGLSHDSINLIAKALEVSGADREKLRDAIETTKNFIGVIAIRNFSPEDHEGAGNDCLALYKIEDMKFKLEALYDESGTLQFIK